MIYPTWKHVAAGNAAEYRVTNCIEYIGTMVITIPILLFATKHDKDLKSPYHTAVL